jgi:hypothetical protein
MNSSPLSPRRGRAFTREFQWQPTPLESGVLPMHVTVALPVTVHAPLQVNVQLP